MISIIMPVYQVEAYLSRCIDSILAQSYQDWELILVEDGSKDSSGKIMDEYAQKDARIQAIHKENGGVSSARNKGLEYAGGEYVIFLDSDDWIETEMLRELAEAIEKNQSDMAACDSAVVTVEADGSLTRKICNKWGGNAAEKTVSGKEAYYSIFYQSGTLWNKLFRRECVKGLTFNEKMTYGEDTDYLIRAIRNCSRITLIPYCGYNYVINRAGNVRSASIDKRSLELLENAKIIYRTLSELGYPALAVYRLYTVTYQVLLNIPPEDCGNPKYAPYLDACKQTVKTAKAGEAAAFLRDGSFGKKARLRYLLFRISPKTFLKRRA